jgi:hypothetical protein
MRGRLAGRLPVGNLLKRRAAAGQLCDRSNRAWKEWRSAVGLAQIAPTRCWLWLLASARPIVEKVEPVPSGFQVSLASTANGLAAAGQPAGTG